jgi:hypothetical protein
MRGNFCKTKLTLKFNLLIELFNYKIVNKKINIYRFKNKKKKNYNNS